MGTDLVSVLERFVLLTFFGGYALLYVLVSVVSGIRPGASSSGWQKLPQLLPVTYAVVGTLFLIFLISKASLPETAAIASLQSWGLLAMLFWIPRLGKTAVLSLLHSLVFFGLIVQDILRGLPTAAGRDLVHNDMTIFSLSFLLNATVFLSVFLVVFVRSRSSRRTGV